MSNIVLNVPPGGGWRPVRASSTSAADVPALGKLAVEQALADERTL